MFFPFNRDSGLPYSKDTIILFSFLQATNWHFLHSLISLLFKGMTSNYFAVLIFKKSKYNCHHHLTNVKLEGFSEGNFDIF